MNRIDRRLIGVAVAVANKNLLLVVDALEKCGLIKRENPADQDDLSIIDPLTESGCDRIFTTITNAVGQQFAAAKVIAPPFGSFEEIDLIKQIMEVTGKAEVSSAPVLDMLRIKWNGPGALIQEMETPLDMGEAVAAALETGSPTIGRFKTGPGLQITAIGDVGDDRWNLTTFASAAKKKNKRGLL